MEAAFHRFSDLFAQLGLASDADSIRVFILTRAPLADDVPLAEASWWSASQADWLRQAVADDADWAEVADQLSVALRRH